METQLNGSYTIQQKNNLRFLDAYSQSKDDFSAVTREAQGNDTQVWIIKPIGNNNYTLQQKSNLRFLDAHSQSKDDFSVVTREAQKNDTQIWIIKLLENNRYTIQQKSNSRFLDAYRQSKDDFSAVTRSAQGNDTQEWILVKSNAVSKHVKVRLLDVVCNKTEDSGPFGSADELTIIWGGFFGTNIVKGQWRIKDIDDGDTKFFPADKTVLFDGTLPENSPVETIITLFDRDHGEGGEIYRKFFNKAIDAIAAKNAAEKKKAAGKGDFLSIAVGVASVAKYMVDAGYVDNIAALIDPDDNLGEQQMRESTSTLSRGKTIVRTLRFKKGADYKVRIQIEVS